MAVTHSTACRNGIANYVVDQLDGGNLVYQTSGDVEVATLAFAATAFGDASGGTATAGTITSDTNATGGTIAKASWQNSSATEVVECSVTATGGGGDIELSSVAISAGDTVSTSSLTYSAPA
jgi:archaellin